MVLIVIILLIMAIFLGTGLFLSSFLEKFNYKKFISGLLIIVLSFVLIITSSIIAKKNTNYYLAETIYLHSELPIVSIVNTVHKNNKIYTVIVDKHNLGEFYEEEQLKIGKKDIIVYDETIEQSYVLVYRLVNVFSFEPSLKYEIYLKTEI